MSIEVRLEELTLAINNLPAAIAAVMGNTTPSVGKSDRAPGVPVQGNGAVVKDSVTTETADSFNNDKLAEEKPETVIAGRKTYVWNKTTKTGQIVEKGGEVPVADHLVNVGKTKWEEACKKYDVDPATGQKVEDKPVDEESKPLAEEAAEDDLGDLDDLGADESDDLGDLDDLDDLGADEPAINRDSVKAVMVRVMREVGREDALKLFKKNGARNFDEIKDDKLGALQNDALAVLKKAGK